MLNVTSDPASVLHRQAGDTFVNLRFIRLIPVIAAFYPEVNDARCAIEPERAEFPVGGKNGGFLFPRTRLH